MTTKRKEIPCYAAEPRKKLFDLGYREYWSIENGTRQTSSRTIASYWANGKKQVILIETVPCAAERVSWDVYGGVSDSNKVDETLAALERFTAA